MEQIYKERLREMVQLKKWVGAVSRAGILGKESRNSGEVRGTLRAVQSWKG